MNTKIVTRISQKYAPDHMLILYFYWQHVLTRIMRDQTGATTKLRYRELGKVKKFIALGRGVRSGNSGTRQIIVVPATVYMIMAPAAKAVANVALWSSMSPSCSCQRRRPVSSIYAWYRNKADKMASVKKARKAVTQLEKRCTRLRFAGGCGHLKSWRCWRELFGRAAFENRSFSLLILFCLAVLQCLPSALSVIEVWADLYHSGWSRSSHVNGCCSSSSLLPPVTLQAIWKH